MTQIGIEFKNVIKRYGDNRSALVVKGISFEVPKGSLTTILGPSGCGKTTTLRMMAGLESPSGGQIFIDGRDVTHLGPAERNVSMVFQSYALFPHMSVIENVGYGLSVSGVKQEEALERAHKAMAAVGLTGYDDRLPSEHKPSFNALRELCSLTDGNLSRHLTTLQEAGLVRIDKTIQGKRPHTQVALTKPGRARFLEYLSLLETIVNGALAVAEPVGGLKTA